MIATLLMGTVSLAQVTATMTGMEMKKEIRDSTFTENNFAGEMEDTGRSCNVYFVNTIKGEALIEIVVAGGIKISSRN